MNWAGATITLGLLALAWTLGTPWGWVLLAALVAVFVRG